MDWKQNDGEEVVAGGGCGGGGGGYGKNSSEEMKRREALVRPGHGDRPPCLDGQKLKCETREIEYGV